MRTLKHVQRHPRILESLIAVLQKKGFVFLMYDTMSNTAQSHVQIHRGLITLLDTNLLELFDFHRFVDRSTQSFVPTAQLMFFFVNIVQISFAQAF